MTDNGNVTHLRIIETGRARPILARDVEQLIENLSEAFTAYGGKLADIDPWDWLPLAQALIEMRESLEASDDLLRLAALAMLSGADR